MSFDMYQGRRALHLFVGITGIAILCAAFGNCGSHHRDPRVHWGIATLANARRTINATKTELINWVVHFDTR
jgi:hypothetical protein